VGGGHPPSAHSPLRDALELVEARLAEGERGEALLAFVAGTRVEIPAAELAAARRRAMLVLAAGGDPHRELEPNAPAVQLLARELSTAARRDALTEGLRDCRDEAVGLPFAAALAARLAGDPDAAWVAYSIALLAEELADE
jgi:hypothetical protein